MNLRRRLLPVHRWVGLTLGLIVLVSAVTGAGMAFRRELDPVVYPQLFKGASCAEPLPLDALAQNAQALHPRGEVDYLRIRGRPDAPVAVRFLNKDTLYFDRCTGALTGSQNRYAGVFGVLEYIHRGQWVDNGGWIMGAGALSALFLLGGVGAFLWWPRKPRRLVQGFILDRRLKGPAFTLGLHRTAGGWIAIVLCVSAITGIPNAYDSVKNGLTALGGAPEPKVHSAPPADKGAPRLPLAAAWRTITSLTPNPREVLIHVARKPKAPLEIFVIEANAPHANARTYLYLDGYSGTVLRFAPYSRSGFGSRLYYWMLSLHTGEVGGVFGQLLIFLGALGVPVLAYTGVKSYLGRELRKRAQRAGSRAPAGKAQRA